MVFSSASLIFPIYSLVKLNETQEKNKNTISIVDYTPKLQELKKEISVLRNDDDFKQKIESIEDWNLYVSPKNNINEYLNESIEKIIATPIIDNNTWQVSLKIDYNKKYILNVLLESPLYINFSKNISNTYNIINYEKLVINNDWTPAFKKLAFDVMGKDNVEIIIPKRIDPYYISGRITFSEITNSVFNGGGKLCQLVKKLLKLDYLILSF